MIGRIDLGVGHEAHAVLTRPIGRGDKNRRAVEGIAVVRVVDPHVDGRYDVFKVTILRSAPAYYVGREIEIKRCDLYASAEPAEMTAFRDFVSLFARAA